MTADHKTSKLADSLAKMGLKKYRWWAQLAGRRVPDVAPHKAIEPLGFKWQACGDEMHLTVNDAGRLLTTDDAGRLLTWAAIRAHAYSRGFWWVLVFDRGTKLLDASGRARDLHTAQLEAERHVRAGLAQRELRKIRGERDHGPT